jgi:NAD(P)-dependent dehydrogenase (short-subunit alcohol dehydrogenase family)
MGRLDGKVAVVTGGSNGIGRACCERFAEEGADVVVADVLDEPGAATVAAVEALGRRALYVHADASSAGDNATAVQAAADELGGLDILVTAAGISSADYRSGDTQDALARLTAGGSVLTDPARALVDLPLSDWQRVLDVNLTGTLLAIQAAARLMLDRGTGGSIITLASIAAKVPEAGTPSYGVSKAGVWMLTKHAARSLAAAGIRVNAIGPGFIDTNMTAVVKAVPELEQRFLGQVPMARMGSAREIAQVALFLASEESSYVTGELLHADGGFFTD